MKLKLFGLEALAIGRYPINCVVWFSAVWMVIAVLVLIGRASGLL